MKISYHHRTLGRGAEGIHIEEMVAAFRKLGHEVEVVSLIGEQTNISNSKKSFLKKITQYCPGFLYELIELSYGIVGCRLLLKQINIFHPDFIYERYNLFNFAGLLSSKLKKVPLVLEVNAPLAYERNQYLKLAWKRLAHFCEKTICKHIDLLVVVSTPLKDYFVKQGIPENRILVTPNSADPDKFAPHAETGKKIRKKYGIPEEAIVIGFVGKLRPWHGVELLVRSMETIVKENGNCHLLIVGYGPSEEELKKQCKYFELNNYVTFTGKIPHHKIPEYLNAFDIAVSPKATFYASPMKILEYMAAQKAVIAPEMPNILDIIEDQKTGLCFQPNNNNDLTEKLLLFIKNDTLQKKIAQNARNKILAENGWQNNVNLILTRLKQLNLNDKHHQF